MLAATSVILGSGAPTPAGPYRLGVVDLVAGQSLEGLLLRDFGIPLRVILRFALAVGSFGMVEDPEQLFTLGVVRDGCNWGLCIWTDSLC